jgi:hypothetical protein
MSLRADQPFDAAEFPFAFLAAFGDKETPIKRRRSGESNRSDLGGTVAQRVGACVQRLIPDHGWQMFGNSTEPNSAFLLNENFALAVIGASGP